MLRPRALAVLTFPTPVRELAPVDARALAHTLHQLGDAVTAGRLQHTGTVIVPRQPERGTMRIEFSVYGPEPNRKACGFTLEQNDLPPEHLVEMAAVSRSFAEFIRNKSGTAAGNDEKYRVVFEYDARQQFALPTQLAPTFKNKATQDELKFSERVAIEDAGLKLLADLQLGAHREIASGQQR